MSDVVWPCLFNSPVALFAKFIQEHQILRVVPDSLEENDINLIPLDDTHSLRREACYLPHLQRIKDRHYYEDMPNFIVEVPLDELADWDNIKGADLAKRASRNAMRYHKLFCSVVDDAINNLQATNNAGAGTNNGLRDTIDILHEQRLAQEAENQANNANNNGPNNNGIVNPFEGNNAMNDEEAGNNNNFRKY